MKGFAMVFLPVKIKVRWYAKWSNTTFYEGNDSLTRKWRRKAVLQLRQPTSKMIKCICEKKWVQINHKWPNKSLSSLRNLFHLHKFSGTSRRSLKESKLPSWGPIRTIWYFKTSIRKEKVWRNIALKITRAWPNKKALLSFRWPRPARRTVFMNSVRPPRSIKP